MRCRPGTSSDRPGSSRSRWGWSTRRASPESHRSGRVDATPHRRCGGHRRWTPPNIDRRHRRRHRSSWRPAAPRRPPSGRFRRARGDGTLVRRRATIRRLPGWVRSLPRTRRSRTTAPGRASRRCVLRAARPARGRCRRGGTPIVEHPTAPLAEGFLLGRARNGAGPGIVCRGVHRHPSKSTITLMSSGPRRSASAICSGGTRREISWFNQVRSAAASVSAAR